jgi:hypothetical protein
MIEIAFADGRGILCWRCRLQRRGSAILSPVSRVPEDMVLFGAR